LASVCSLAPTELDDAIALGAPGRAFRQCFGVECDYQ
jgi:hypothetical protein